MPRKISSRKIIEWDIVNWSSALTYWEKTTSHDLSNSMVLEIGAYNGGLSLWFAGKNCKVVCSDLNGPTEKAKQKHLEHGVQNLIEYQSINALHIPYDSLFDIVTFKSVLGGIGRNNKPDLQDSAIEQMYKVLKPGGELFFAENLVASPIHRFFRKRFVKWGSEWRYVTIKEMKELLTGFSSIKYTTVGFLGAFGRREWQRNILGYFDRVLFNHLTPPTWRYIMIGIAKK
jgi:SAM-dependent methyltransferase